jgi:hypothetical protein
MKCNHLSCTARCGASHLHMRRIRVPMSTGRTFADFAIAAVVACGQAQTSGTGAAGLKGIYGRCGSLGNSVRDPGPRDWNRR